jgi:hypothetical protein
LLLYLVRLQRTRSDRSPTPVIANRDFLPFHDHRDCAIPLGMLQHLLHADRILRHVHVFYGDLALAELLTGGRRVGSGILAEDENRVSH